MANKPATIFDREREWADLVAFVSEGRGARLASVYGRRRQGKSLLLQELARSVGGLYWEAAQQSSAQNLVSFSAAWQRHRGLQAGPVFRSWEDALEAVFTPGPAARPLTLLVDEVGYLVEGAPEFPSLLQRLVGPLAATGADVAVVLCGSVYAQMTKLFAAGQPLRGRQQRNLRVDPFDYRTAARFWGLDRHTDAAFRLHALIGGTPAYRRFAGDREVRGGNVDRWVVEHLLDPASPLYQEGDVLVAEDPTLVDKSLYWSVLQAIADGHRRRSAIATAIGRPPTALAQPLRVLAEGAWIELRPDPLHARASTVLLTEPMLRTHRILVAAERYRIERNQAAAVWDDAQPRVARLIYGPHLEWLAAEWLGRYARPDSAGGVVRSAGPATLRDRGQVHQLDVVVTTLDERDREVICAVGEVKAETSPVGVGELDRLDAVVAALGGRAASAVRRLLVGRRGFTADLRRVARRRGDVELIDLDRLYDGE